MFIFSAILIQYFAYFLSEFSTIRNVVKIFFYICFILICFIFIVDYILLSPPQNKFFKYIFYIFLTFFGERNSSRFCRIMDFLELSSRLFGLLDLLRITLACSFFSFITDPSGKTVSTHILQFLKTNKLTNIKTHHDISYKVFTSHHA